MTKKIKQIILYYFIELNLYLNNEELTNQFFNAFFYCADHETEHEKKEAEHGKKLIIYCSENETDSNNRKLNYYCSENEVDNNNQTFNYFYINK